MKQGEKRAFQAVLIAFVGVLVFTVYYEIQYQKHDETKNPSKAPAGVDLSPVSDEPKVWVIPKGLNPRDLPEPEGRGATVLLLYCAQCHDVPTPAMHSADEWEQVLQRMEKRMQARRGGMIVRVMIPPEKDWKSLREYLTKHAQIPADKEKLADLDTPEGQAFQSTCSQCHAMPDPAQHTANEWPRVVVRMKSNIQAAGLEAPEQGKLDMIIQYLQDHSPPKTT